MPQPEPRRGIAYLLFPCLPGVRFSLSLKAVPGESGDNQGLPLLAVRAASVEDDVVPGDGVRHARCELVERALERRVLEWHDPLALVADHVVVMLAARCHRFVAALALAGVEALHELQVVQGLERSVDARDPDRATLVAQRLVDLLRASCAVLAAEVLDDRVACAAAAEAAVPEHTARVDGPGAFLRHAALPGTKRAASAAIR